MKSFIMAAALAGLAAAQNQKMDVAAIAAAPSPAVTQAPVGAAGQGDVSYDQEAAASSAAIVRPTSAPAAKIKRAACDPEPAGTAPNTVPDTTEAFQRNPFFHGQANSWPVYIPSGNSFYAERFRDKNGSTQQNSYLTYYVLDKYSVTDCAKKCDAVDLCTAFNIYVERDPSLNPGPACPDPKSVSNYKCALWGSDISAETATNVGQYREKFHVVITASNGYSRASWAVPDPIKGFQLAQNLSNKAITSAAKSAFLGAEYFPGPYDASLCGYYATAQTAANKEDAKVKGLKSYQPCNLFNAYFVYKNKYAQGTYCQLFNADVDGVTASGKADTVYNGDSYSVGASYTWRLTPQDSGSL
ncbi:hypothetical protein Slin15195_G058950 [Septoria linicola]|uniref:Uncharacterized protein n=1 Tax=Septoria linicola TaxID=215465 RepID=A0A9Q9EI94_9PEZI|nr:hypothetical protein Slin14017_G074810 [Septoria linicola]USW52576.1 hypothetical protein Slin15195_G058950 [Septoria linicola]